MNEANSIISRFMFGIIFIFLLSSCELKEKEMKVGRYSNNNISFLKRYKENILNGESVWFYPNGNVEEKVIFRNGKANGHAYYFYESGALKSQRFWINDKMVGFCTDYYDDTVSIAKASLYFNSNGDLIYRKTFDESGKMLKVESNNESK